MADTSLLGVSEHSLLGETLGSGDLNADGQDDFFVAARAARVGIDDEQPAQGAEHSLFGLCQHLEELICAHRLWIHSQGAL